MTLGKRMGSTSHKDLSDFMKRSTGFPIIGKLLGHKHKPREVIAGAASTFSPAYLDHALGRLPPWCSRRGDNDR